MSNDYTKDECVELDEFEWVPGHTREYETWDPEVGWTTDNTRVSGYCRISRNRTQTQPRSYDTGQETETQGSFF